VQRRKAGGHDRAVRRTQRNDVGDRREGAELQELVLLHRVRQVPEERARKAERDAGAGELLVVGRIARPARIDERIRLRKYRRAASARRIQSTARSRSSIGGPWLASVGVRNAGMSRSARPRARRIWTTRPGIPSGASPPDVPSDLGMIQRRCGTSVMTSKYRS